MDRFGVGYYVPPLSPPALDAQGRETSARRIPLASLESLFGPGVAAALATLEQERGRRRKGEPSALMDLLIAYDWNKSFKLAPRTREVL